MEKSMKRTQMAVVAVLAWTCCVGVAFGDRKGGLRKSSSTPVYQNADGKLANGLLDQKGEKTSILEIEDKSKGSLLVIRIDNVPRNVAYSTASRYALQSLSLDSV